MVALLTECVDRNAYTGVMTTYIVIVALLTECVDRNEEGEILARKKIRSHSLRSAWIEICGKIKPIEWAFGRTPYGVRG